MATFSFEDGLGPTASGNKLVPADRTRKPKPGLTLADVGGTSDKIGTLPKDQSIFNMIRGEAKAAGVPEEYVFALAEQESGYNPAAHNAEFGATGILQYIPSTAKARGIDPRDPAASIRAAAQDFKAAMDEGGVDWAIKNHFAGPNTKGHGPKTRQYLADVAKRAEDIRALLTAQSDAGEVGGMSDAGPKQQVGTFSFEDGLGAEVRAAPEVPKQESPLEYVASGISNAAQIAGEKATAAWDYITKRLSDDSDTFLGQKVQVYERTPEEIDRYIKENPYAAPKGLHFSRESELKALREQLRYVRVVDESGKPKPVEKTPGKGFFANLENPMKLLTEDSLPANIVEYLSSAPAAEGRKFLEARKVMQQEQVAANPTRYSAAEVESAKASIAQRKAKQDMGVRAMWDDLKKAAKEDPGRFAAQLANAIIADPEMLLAPEGIGIKVASGIQRAATGSSVATKVTRIADRVVDAGSTGAALNLGMEAAGAASEGRELTAGEAGMAVGLGFGLSGGIGGLAEVFSRGARARAKISEGNVNADTLEQALRDAAQEDIAVEQLIEDPNSVPTAVKEQIETELGIKNLTDTEKKRWHTARQRELTQTFREQSLEADYLKFKAEERISRRTQLAEEGEARRATEAAEAAKQREVELAYQENQAARSARFADDYEQAVRARDEQVATGEQADATVENQLREATRKLDEQEIFESALDGDVPAIRSAMLRATQRDAKLARPKWQRGEADPRIIASLGIGSLFAGTAFAVAPEEQKLSAALAGGLAGLIIPRGGNVLRRMKQAGAISADGDLFVMSKLVKEGKLKPTKEIDEIKARESEQINLARQGDQRAFKELFEDNYQTAERYARKFLRGTDIDPADVAQESFVKAFQNLEKFQGDSQFSTWLYSIVKNSASDARREANTLRGGGSYEMQSAELPDVATPYGERYSRDVFDEGAGAQLDDTPENQKIREDSEKIITNTLEKMNERKRQTFILNRIEGYTAEEIAQITGQSKDAVLKQMQFAQDEILEAIEKGFGATKRQILPEEPKRGRGRPRKQAGEIDPTWLKTAAVLGIGGTAGAAFADKNKAIGALGGALTGALLFGGGMRGIKQVGKFADDIYGASSTRILNKSPAVHRRILTTERRILEGTHQHIEQVDPFLIKLSKMPKEGAGILTRALMTGKGAVIDKILTAFNDADLTNAYKGVRKSLDSLGDQLVNLKRFTRGNIEYFPRIVKDKEGLFKAIGKQEGDRLQQILQDANVESLRKNGRPLSEIEESAIINQQLFVDKRTVQPGFTKNRGIEEITPELQPFYASPAESLHSYIRGAVQDIEAAKFFGDYARNMKRGNHEFIDVDRSVKHMIAEDVKSGKLTSDDAQEVADILRTRFKEGMKAESDLIRNIKNIGNIGLLGNFWSAATQMADVGVQIYTQGLRPTLESVVRQLTGKKLVDMKDFGLADHISEEFAGQLRTSRWVNKVFKATLFEGVDRFGKNTALNAAIIRAKNLVQTDSGVQRLANKYQESFGEDFNKLVSELKSGKISDLTRDYAFMELSRTQPVTRIEMPLAYLKHPNMRSYLWLKSFTMKQLDLVRRDSYNEIKKGNVATGLKNLTQMGVIMGVSGATTEQVKAWMMGKDEKLELSDIPVNMFKTFGFSEYMRDQFSGVSKEEAAERREAGDKTARTKAAQPISAIANSFAPPFKMFDQLLSGDPRAIRFLVPGIGPYLAEQVRKETQLKKEVQENE